MESMGVAKCSIVLRANLLRKQDDAGVYTSEFNVISTLHFHEFY
jgi:hypothetical protein